MQIVLLLLCHILVTPSSSEFISKWLKSVVINFHVWSNIFFKSLVLPAIFFSFIAFNSVWYFYFHNTQHAKHFLTYLSKRNLLPCILQAWNLTSDLYNSGTCRAQHWALHSRGEGNTTSGAFLAGSLEAIRFFSTSKKRWKIVPLPWKLLDTSVRVTQLMYVNSLYV